MMNSEQIISIYEKVSSLTGQMLAAAQTRDWENLAVLESHCTSQVAVLKQAEPALPLSGELRAKKIRIIHQIMAQDREIRTLTEPWMAELATLINSAGTERNPRRTVERRGITASHADDDHGVPGSAHTDSAMIGRRSVRSIRGTTP